MSINPYEPPGTDEQSDFWQFRLLDLLALIALVAIAVQFFKAPSAAPIQLMLLVVGVGVAWWVARNPKGQRLPFPVRDVLIGVALIVTGLSAASFAWSSNHPMMDPGSVYGISFGAAACLGAAIAGALKGRWEMGAAIGFAFGLVAIVFHFYVVFPFFYWER